VSEESEYVTATQARQMLGIGPSKMAELIANGTLKTTENPFNKRAKLVRRADVEKLMALYPRPKRGPAAAA
jgi:hypothetical protein